MYEHFFQRLADERNRLGLTQDQMAKAGGVAKRTYCNYETGDREPPSSFISSIKEVGVDIGYLLFGVREFDSLGTSPSEERLLNLYRQLSDDNKRSLEAVAVTLAQPHLAKVMAKIASAENHKNGTKSQPALHAGGTVHSHVKQQINAPVSGGVAGRDLVHKGRKKKNEAGDQQ